VVGRGNWPHSGSWRQFGPWRHAVALDVIL